MKRTFWRLGRKPYASSAFDGEGPRLFGGRWNSKGVPMVYCASSLSLAALEVLVHLDVADAPTDFISIRADLPDRVKVEERDVASLPRDWRSYPAPRSLQAIGDAWVASGRTVAIIVPSAVTPIESNILLNPAHPDLSKLTKGTPQAYHFDPRLF